MARYDFRTPRLYVEAPLRSGAEVPLDRDRSNYLFNVLRLADGAPVLVFNGRDGEWRSSAGKAGKRGGVLRLGEQLRAQTPPGDLHLLFAPLKHARLDYLMQKAVEMGVSRIQAVITQHTQVTRVNLERMRANVIEAAQQCGVLNLAEVAEPLRFGEMLERMEPARVIVFCDEDAEVRDPIAALGRSRPAPPLAVLLGPEGGFSEAEREALIRRGHVLRISLGPRILRADTAAVAALALVQAVLGDWRGASG
jgi:16S rRNA (uracil1498-N3)-methyltransferase